VETGDLASGKTRALMERYVAPLLEQNADTLVLGCTHYPFLAPLIQEIAGPTVAIIDPSAAIARELRRRLSSADLLSFEERAGSEQFWTSATTDVAQTVIAQLWQADVDVQRLPTGSTAWQSSW
jgi:glutamate racemase